MSTPANHSPSGNLHQIHDQYKNLMEETLFEYKGKNVTVRDISQCIKPVTGFGHVLRFFNRLKNIDKGWVNDAKVQEWVGRLTETPEKMKHLLAVMGKMSSFSEALGKLDESALRSSWDGGKTVTQNLADMQKLEKCVGKVGKLLDKLKPSLVTRQEVLDKLHNAEKKLKELQLVALRADAIGKRDRGEIDQARQNCSNVANELVLEVDKEIEILETYENTEELIVALEKKKESLENDMLRVEQATTDDTALSIEYFFDCCMKPLEEMLLSIQQDREKQLNSTTLRAISDRFRLINLAVKELKSPEPEVSALENDVKTLDSDMQKLAALSDSVSLDEPGDIEQAIAQQKGIIASRTQELAKNAKQAKLVGNYLKTVDPYDLISDQTTPLALKFVGFLAKEGIEGFNEGALKAYYERFREETINETGKGELSDEVYQHISDAKIQRDKDLGPLGKLKQTLLKSDWSDEQKLQFNQNWAANRAKFTEKIRSLEAWKGEVRSKFEQTGYLSVGVPIIKEIVNSTTNLEEQAKRIWQDRENVFSEILSNFSLEDVNIGASVLEGQPYDGDFNNYGLFLENPPSYSNDQAKPVTINDREMQEITGEVTLKYRDSKGDVKTFTTPERGSIIYDEKTKRVFSSEGAARMCDMTVPPDPGEQGAQVAVFADGCGQNKLSQDAARIGSKAAHDYVKNHKSEIKTVRDAVRIQIDGVLAAHKAINEQEIDESTSGRQTTTLASVMAVDGRLVGVTVGDSKVFIIRKGKILEPTAASRDLSFDAKDPGGRIGFTSEEKIPDLRNLCCFDIPLEDEDVVCLVSDGIHDNLDPDTLGLSPLQIDAEGELKDEKLTLSGGDYNWNVGNPDHREKAKAFMHAKLGEVVKDKGTPAEIGKALEEHAEQSTIDIKVAMLKGEKTMVPHHELRGKQDHAKVIVFKVKS